MYYVTPNQTYYSIDRHLRCGHGKSHRSRSLEGSRKNRR